jgi:hypothetical protein
MGLSCNMTGERMESERRRVWAETRMNHDVSKSDTECINHHHRMYCRQFIAASPQRLPISSRAIAMISHLR